MSYKITFGLSAEDLCQMKNRQEKCFIPDELAKKLGYSEKDIEQGKRWVETMEAKALPQKEVGLINLGIFCRIFHTEILTNLR